VLWAFAFVRRVICAPKGADVKDVTGKGKANSKKDDSKKDDSKNDDNNDEEDANAQLALSFVYGTLLVQMIFFLILGCFIARLKVLGLPPLFALAASAATPFCAECCYLSER